MDEAVRWIYFMVNVIRHEWLEKLVEVMVAVQVAPPLPMAFLFHLGAGLVMPVKSQPGAMVFK